MIPILYIKQSDLYQADRVILKKEMGDRTIEADKNTKGLYLYDHHYYDLDADQVYERIPKLNPNSQKILPYYENKKYFYDPKRVFPEATNDFCPLDEFLSENSQSTLDLKTADEELLYRLYVKTDSLYLGPVSTIEKDQKAIIHYQGCALLLRLEERKYYDLCTNQIYESKNLIEIEEFLKSPQTPIAQNICWPIALEEVKEALPEYINIKTVLEFAEATKENNQEAQEYYVRKRG